MRYCVIFSLCFFFFHQFLYAQEEVEEDNFIREGPPPLVDPLYLDLGTFVVNMPDDKYFLKSSIQLAFENGAAKEWLESRLPIARDLIITHLNSITVAQFDDTKTGPLSKMIYKKDLIHFFPTEHLGEIPYQFAEYCFWNFIVSKIVISVYKYYFV